MTVRLVCFDLDGVLVDSYEAWFVGVNDVAERLGFPPITAEAFEAGFGQGVAEDVRTFYPGADERVIMQEYDDLMPRNVEHMRLNPETIEGLTWLGAQGIHRTVVTNTQQSLCDRILDVHGIRPCVDDAIGVRPGLREKPAPDLITHALSTAGVATDAAWMVGDTDYDGDAAHAAGVRFQRYVMRAGTSLRETLQAIVADG